MTEGATSEAGAAVEKKPRLRGRVPTSLIVTLLGIALTAWLLPAFTRQWDDRQKAHEVQASLIEEMASASASAVSAAKRLDLATRRTQHVTDSPTAATEWSVASLTIEAKLRAYFGGRLVDRWAFYRSYVERTLDEASGGDGSYYPVRAEHDYSQFLLDSELHDYDPRRSQADAMDGIALYLLNEEEHIAGQVLEAHPIGYSTTAGDLFRDLSGGLIP